ncbi:MULTISPECIES: fimbria/pilus outer membrane usher protein [Providencia]|uniref:fimbria/pilus outer membrane usher protein n=1 Tax=Providencia TaxID=586 RepID=UPI0018A756FD|nr:MULTISPECIES: fimbria/pilus outer membrane usher protein [Providencia]
MTSYNNKVNLLPSVRFCLRPLAAGIFLTLSPWMAAEDYFDPRFLGLTSENNAIDLSVFAMKGGVAEGKYTVSVFVNTRSEGGHTLEFRKNADNVVVPLLTPSQLESWGVNVSGVPGLSDLPADKPVDNLGKLIPQASVKLDLSRLRLDISIPQIAMRPHYGRYADPSLWEDGIPALLTNYSLSAGRSSMHSGGQTTHDDNLFATLRSGLNAGAWRLRSTITHTYSGGSSTRQSSSNTRFSNTYLSRAIQTLRSSLLIGESQTGSEIFDSVPFKGMKLSSDEQMLPNQLRGFAPAVSGVANSNARITIRQNGNVVYETYVAPGPFSINDIQQSGMSGDYDVTVTEADGSEHQFIVPYSSLPVMLRPGGWKYEFTGGRYDSDMAVDTRRADFILGTAVYGLLNNITLYGGTLIARDYQSVSAGSGISLGSLGALSADITHSNAKFHEDQTKTGQSYRIRYSKSLVSTGTSVDLTALRYSTEHYYTFNEFNREGYRLEDGVSPWTQQRRRSSFQTQISQQMDTFGTLHLRYSRDDYWGGDKSLTGMSLGYSNSIKGVGIGLNYNIDRLKSDKNQWPENRQVSLNVSIPFSIFSPYRDFQSMYATTSITHDNNGKTSNYTGISGNTLDGALSYSVNQGWGNQGQAANSNVNVGYQGNQGNVSAGYSYSNTMQSMNMNVSGGMLVHSGGVTLSRPFGDSVALVSAPDADGVSVNGKAAVTDSRGYAVVPYLSNYTRNSIGLDPTTLPDDVDLKQTNINVYPTKGAVVNASFSTRVGYKVLMTLKHQQGVVPFGAVASLVDTKPGEEDISGVVGDYGQVYLAGLPETGKLRVKWGSDSSQQCTAQFNLSKLVMSQDIAIRQLAVSCLGDNILSEPVIPVMQATIGLDTRPSSAVKKNSKLQ